MRKNSKNKTLKILTIWKSKITYNFCQGNKIYQSTHCDKIVEDVNQQTAEKSLNFCKGSNRAPLVCPHNRPFPRFENGDLRDCPN